MEESTATNRSGEKGDFLGNRVLDLTFVLLVTVVVVVPAVLTSELEAARISRQERRHPAPTPQVPASPAELRGFFEQTQAYLEDHFGLRQRLIRWNSRARLAAGLSASQRVTVGRDGWLCDGHR